jgi:hypothetical protein
VIDLSSPTDVDGTSPAVGFQVCLASVLEVPLDEVPPPVDELSASIGLWRSWLAGQGLGLVPIADARTFAWAGFWIALVGAARSDRPTVTVMFGTPPGVVLSPQDPTLLGRAAADLPVSQGFVVAALDPAQHTAAGSPGVGRVEVIAVAPAAEAPMRVVDSARAIPGRGLEGDRYAAGAGTFTPRSGKGLGYDLTLIEAEVLDGMTLPDGSTLDPVQARRNLVTRGIDLTALVGRRFLVGDVECIGRRLCEPCAHLERLTQRGVLRALIHQGGLRADILTDGVIREGAAIIGTPDVGQGGSSSS